MKAVWSVIIASILISSMTYTNDLAVVCSPVADLAGSPLDTTFPVLGRTVPERYKFLPFCGSSIQGGIACPRVHQLLFHEVVTVVSWHEHQACVTIPHLFYVTHENPNPQNLYWTLKKNLIPLDQLQPPSAVEHLPPPIDFATPDALCQDKNIVGLIIPWYNGALKMTFSAGTRFKYDPEKTTESAYHVYILNPKTKECELHTLPKDYALVHTEQTHANAVKTFISILRRWARIKKGYIPYVWGGCSYCTELEDPEFKEYVIPLTSHLKTSWYNRPSYQGLKTGFDCAGLIARAAQLSGIPYYYKNTLTLSLHLDELEHNQSLEEGDLIWIPGHVMVISSLTKNMIIEARSYVSGYGVVHEIPLHEIFKGIDTYDQLIHAFFNRIPLIRLDKAGNEIEKIKRFKLLKMNSVWKHTKH